MLRSVTQSAIKRGSIGREIVSFGTALRRYLAILLALLRREEEYRRATPMESVASLLEPAMATGIFTMFHWLVSQTVVGPLGGSIVLFYSSGFFVHFFFVYLSRRMGRSVESPSRRFPIEQRLDHIIVHVVLSVIDYMILGVLGFGAIYFCFSTQALPYDFIPIIQACVAIVMLGFGWGVLNLVMSRVWKVWPYCFAPVSRGLMIVSGTFFVADFLPPGIRYVLSFNPLLHAVSLFRMGFYRNQPTLVLDTTYLGCCAILAVLFGLVLERVTRRSEK